MRILITNPQMTFYGGAETVIVKLANYLKACGHDVTILSRYVCLEIIQDLDGVHIVSQQDAPPKETIPRFLFSNVQFLWRNLKTLQYDYDVINAHNFPANCVFVTKVPVVWMCNEPPRIVLRMDSLGFSIKDILKQILFPLVLWFDRSLLKNIAKTVVADTYNRTRFRALYGTDSTIIPYGVDWNYYSAGKPDPDYEFKDTFTILQVGIMTQEKNQIASLVALKEISKTIPNATMIFAGTGEEAYKSRLDEFIRVNNLQKRVFFLGHVGKERVRYLYHNCNVLLHPVKPQGGWLAPFEAISAGIPVIVSTELTAASIILENNLGVVTDDYVTALIEVNTHYEKHRNMSNNRSEWVREHLSWEVFSAAMLNVFESVSGRGNA